MEGGGCSSARAHTRKIQNKERKKKPIHLSFFFFFAFVLQLFVLIIKKKKENGVHCWYEALRDHLRICDGDFETGDNDCICQIDGITVGCYDPLLTKATCPDYVEQGKKTTHTHTLRLLGRFTTPSSSSSLVGRGRGSGSGSGKKSPNSENV